MLFTPQFGETQKELLKVVATKLETWESTVVINFAPKLLTVITTKTMGNEEGEYEIRKRLANAYYTEENYQQAARVIVDMRLDQVKE